MVQSPIFWGLNRVHAWSGWAMYGCPQGLPAHRVVNSAGLLTGKHHFKTPKEMQRRLEKEGISVVKDKIKHFKDVFWDPTKELAFNKTKSENFSSQNWNHRAAKRPKNLQFRHFIVAQVGIYSFKRNNL